jgi:hypothetical protein
MTQPATTPSAPGNPPGSGSLRTRNPIASNPITSAAIFVLVFGDILGTLIVPIYASETPKLGDFPFFYWYQLIYMPITAVVLYLAMLLQKRLARHDETRKAA